MTLYTNMKKNCYEAPECQLLSTDLAGILCQSPDFTGSAGTLDEIEW